MALLAKSGVGHDINCHYYTPEEINLAIQRPVVQLLFELICFRHSDPAFDGSFSLPETNDTKIAIRWDKGQDWAMLEVDFDFSSYRVSSSSFASPCST